jgi:16S rRNA (adenine1518-N6/adenine1519-N6)-dimethyltransferase
VDRYPFGGVVIPKEFFDVVDEEDRVIGQASREEVHKKGSIHRSVMFFVFDGKGKLLITERTKEKEFFPEYWSIALGGHVHAGENYDKAAEREIQEELGIKTKPFFIDSFKKRIPQEKENVRVYGVVVKGKVHLNYEELEKGEFRDVDELEELLEKEKFLPETENLLQILKRYMSSRKRQNI